MAGELGTEESAEAAGTVLDVSTELLNVWAPALLEVCRSDSVGLFSFCAMLSSVGEVVVVRCGKLLGLCVLYRPWVARV